MITRRHFQELANICASIADPVARELVVKQMIAFGQRENHGFNPDRFRAAVEQNAVNCEGPSPLAFDVVQ